jgi:thioredoxin reductase (NADPH)
MRRGKDTTHEVIVIGAGTAGLAAATEAVRCGLSTALFDNGMLGGLLANVGAVHGHVGAEDTAGAELISTMLGEAIEAGVDYQPCEVGELGISDEVWSVPGHGVKSRQVILATGARLSNLGVPGESELMGRGVSQCAYCDGGLYREKEVAVIGGGDSAFQEALHLAELCAVVTMVLRGGRPRARATFIGRAAETDNIRFRFLTDVREIIGSAEDGVTGVHLYDQEERTDEVLPVSAVFPFVGLTPATELAPTHARRDEAGGLVVDERMQTNQPGLYAIGAARTGHGGQVAHAIADAKTAAHAAWRATSGR